MGQVENQSDEITQENKGFSYVCIACEAASETYESYCAKCKRQGTLSIDTDVNNEITPNRNRTKAKRADQVRTRPIEFHPTGKFAWDAALGGGLVIPSTVLVMGPKGTGKSTGALSIALQVAKDCNGSVLYGSSEMSNELLKAYMTRLGFSEADFLYFYLSDSGDAEDVLSDIAEFRPTVVIWDSVQRFRWQGELGVTELSNVFAAAVKASATYKTASLLISHVTKDEEFVGRSEMGHDVDVILELRKKGADTLAVECPDKNRFAVTPRVGFEKLKR